MAGKNVKANLYTTNDPTGRTQGQVFKANFAPIGIDVNVKALPFAVLNRAVGDPKEPYDIVLNGWFADYPDPVDFINILLDGRNITSQNNVNVPLMNVAAYDERMEQAERQGEVCGLRQARRRHHAERGTVGGRVQRHRPRVRLPEGRLLRVSGVDGDHGLRRRLPEVEPEGPRRQTPT